MNDSPAVRSNWFSFVAIAAAIGGILFPISSFVELYQMPVDTACRPMGQAATILLCGFGTPLIVIILGLLGWTKGRIERICCIAALLLSFIPLPLYYFLLRWIVDSHHLIMEP